MGPSVSAVHQIFILLLRMCSVMQSATASAVKGVSCDAECHCKAGHVDKSKLGKKSYSAMDSGAASPVSGSEAGWGPENKESKHKVRLAKLFHRRPKSDGASHHASSVADSQATESSRHEVGHHTIPASDTGSEAGWAPESKENKHKARLAKLFHRRPKSHGASPDASSMADSLATESSRYEVGFPCLQHIAVTLSSPRTADPVALVRLTQG